MGKTRSRKRKWYPHLTLDRSAVKWNSEGLLDVKEIFWRGKYKGFAKSKSTLLIFRKVRKRAITIESYIEKVVFTTSTNM